MLLEKCSMRIVYLPFVFLGSPTAISRQPLQRSKYSEACARIELVTFLEY